jgi:hypothetical protein
LYPAEIFPLEVRAKGNAFGVVGWSKFSTTILVDKCFADIYKVSVTDGSHFCVRSCSMQLERRHCMMSTPQSNCIIHPLTSLSTRYIFGVANIITIPMVWALYPETNQRTLEVRNRTVTNHDSRVVANEHRKSICYSRLTRHGYGPLKSTLRSSRKRIPILCSLPVAGTQLSTPKRE